MKKVIKVLKKYGQRLELMSFEMFEKEMGVKWCRYLRFSTSAFERKVRRRAAYAMRKKELNLRQRWLGIHFAPAIVRGYMPDVSIRYIDQAIGHGVFAETALSKGEYIGEYAGVIRTRKPRADRKNDYCFTYAIGDWLYNPFIIDSKQEGNMARYMNHSQHPNVESLSVFADGLMHIIFVAQRGIKKGEQLCYHYGDRFWKKRRSAINTLQN